ncbi:hypothetical protein EJB05_43456, partial [Eragrostis curvula]
MPVGMAPPAVGHAVAAIGGGVQAEEPLEVTGKADAPPEEDVSVMGSAETEGGEDEGEESDDDEEGEGHGEGEDDDVEEQETEEEEAEEEEEEEEGEEEEEEEEEGEKWLKHYSSMQSILLVGDGDFSFSLALATAFRSGSNLTATSLDTYEDLKTKYSKAESNITELKRLGAKILHGVDVKTMRLHIELKSRRFDRVVFNFPHAGFKGKEDQVHIINLHKKLVRSFFNNAFHMLYPYGEIHVSHKMGQPYDRWELECLAAEVSLIMFDKVCFQKEDYPGYDQKRGSGSRCDQPFPLGPCCTFKFQIGYMKKRKKPKQKRAGPFSLIGGHNARADNLAKHIRPSHLPPHVQALSCPRFPPMVHMVPVLTALQHCVVVQRHQPVFSLNFNGPVKALYINPQGTIQPVLTMPGPLLNALPSPGGIPPAVGRIARPNPVAPQDQPLYVQRTVASPPGRDNYSYFDYRLEMQRRLEMQGRLETQRRHEAQRQHEAQRRLGIQRQHEMQMRLEMQREHEIHRQMMMMPGATGLIISSAFLEDRRREYVQKKELLHWKMGLCGSQ